MLTSCFDSQLSLLETQLRDLSAALCDGRALEMQALSARLQALAVELVQTVEATGRGQFRSPSQIQRVSALASGLAAFRENLMRQSAYVQHALGVLVPATRQKSTYAGSGLYGGAIRRSGEFTAFTA